MAKSQIRTTITSEEKKWGILNDVNFAEAMSIGLRVIKKRIDGIPALLDRQKKIKTNIERLNLEYDAITKEIIKLKEKEQEQREAEIKLKEKIESQCPVCFETLNKRAKNYDNKKFCSMNCIAEYKEQNKK